MDAGGRYKIPASYTQQFSTYSSNSSQTVIIQPAFQAPFATGHDDKDKVAPVYAVGCTEGEEPSA